MREQIIWEVVREAREFAVSDTPNGGKSFNVDVFYNKFAELIVQECVAQIEIERSNPYRNMGDENRYGIGACVESIRRIKHHFGVE